MAKMRNAKGQFVTNRLDPNFQLMCKVVENTLSSRTQLMKQFLDPRRSIDDDCGYPHRVEDIRIEDYRDLYDREAVANRVVGVLPSASWQTTPKIIEDEDVTVDTDFEIALSELVVGPQQSWLKTEHGAPLWEYLHRVDRLSGIGMYGILLIGIDDGKELSEPAEGISKSGQKEGKVKDKKLLYLRAMDQSMAQITAWEQDVTNPRYSLPTEYMLHFSDPRSHSEGSGPTLTSQKVHWSRVIHIADNLGSSEVLGVPRQQSVYNRLLDLRKLYGGCAEMYWRGAFPGIALTTQPQLGGDVEIDMDAIKTEMENYMNSLQRFIALVGIDAKSLAPQVVDPTPQINVEIEAICIQIDVPKRIFVGSERGELASSQDDSAWNDTIRTRQNEYLTPRVVSPTIDRFIMLGILPEPKSYAAVWPDLDSLTDIEQAAVAVQRTDAMAKFVQGGVDAMLHPMDFYTRILGMTTEEAKIVLETVQTEEPILEHEDNSLEEKEDTE